MTFGPQVVISAGRSLARGLLDLTLPQMCGACGQWIPGEAGLACDACAEQIVRAAAAPFCTRCGRTMPATAIHEEGCARCRSEQFWNVGGVIRVGPFDGPLRAALLELKYRGNERNAVCLGEMLAIAIRGQPWCGELDALVPVPMHWLRRAVRPCDHARSLTRATGRRLGLPTVRMVRRAQHRPSQTGFSSHSRRFENVKDCFALLRSGQERLKDRVVCIIDNLLVSGATVHEVSKVLRRGGVKRIYAAVVARSPAPGDPVAGAVVESADIEG